MNLDNLRIFERPKLNKPNMLMGFSGWMNGGDVSIGTVQSLISKLDAYQIAEIEPEDFYIYNFPGMMEVTALFRPYTRINQGIIREFDFPANNFYCNQQNNLILFQGKEPNLRWEHYAECIFSFCEQFNVKMIYFIGSVSGLVPHTRDPKLFCSVSEPGLTEKFIHYGVQLSDYEGPASIVTYLTHKCRQKGLSMVSLVATIPAYVQGSNPHCIETVTRRIAGMLDLHLDIDDLIMAGDEFQKKLDRVVEEQPELADNIRKLEEDYDNQIFDQELGELKRWLQNKGIRVD